MLGILDNSYEAFCLDEAVWRFGTGVEHAVKEAAKSTGKRDTEAKQEERASKVLHEMLGLPVPKRKTRPIPASKVRK